MRARSRTGQVALYLIMALLAVFTLALLNVDTFLAVRAKMRVENGGDAAAIAAARKQGSLLNEIGRLNVAHIEAALEGDREKGAEIVLRQRRLALIGPLDALRCANDAAKKNSMPVRDEFAKILSAHVSDIISIYAAAKDENDPYPESYPEAWTEYANTIAGIAAEGLATGPDNIEFYHAAGGHLLLRREFYHAIAGRDWCWFHFNAYSALADYSNYQSWSPLPEGRGQSCDNSEIFSLHVHAVTGSLADMIGRDEAMRLVKEYGSGKTYSGTAEFLEGEDLLDDENETWFFFEESAWGRWFNGRALAGDEDGGTFPIIGEVKDEYNVFGAGAVCRSVYPSDSLANNTTSDHIWCAAAKPFGAARDAFGAATPVTASSFFVIPAFTDARLIPVDAAPGACLATADFEWVNHVRNHIAKYLEKGPRANSCYYCEQLRAWERPSFHHEGVIWLKYNSGTCVRSTGGTGSSGGTSRGH